MWDRKDPSPVLSWLRPCSQQHRSSCRRACRVRNRRMISPAVLRTPSAAIAVPVASWALLHHRTPRASRLLSLVLSFSPDSPSSLGPEARHLFVRCMCEAERLCITRVIESSEVVINFPMHY